MVVNLEIKKKMLETDVKQWQLAQKLNVSETTMSRRLRSEITGQELQDILTVIDKIKNERLQQEAK